MNNVNLSFKTGSPRVQQKSRWCLDPHVINVMKLIFFLLNHTNFEWFILILVTQTPSPDRSIRNSVTHPIDLVPNSEMHLVLIFTLDSFFRELTAKTQIVELMIWILLWAVIYILPPTYKNDLYGQNRPEDNDPSDVTDSCERTVVMALVKIKEINITKTFILVFFSMQLIILCSFQPIAS